MNEKTNIDLAREWLTLAERDTRVIPAIIVPEYSAWHVVCFHAQQAIEKYLKAVVAFKGLHLRKIHDLEDLCSDCLPELELLWSERRSELAQTTNYCATGRYGYDFDADERLALEAQALAQEVREHVLAVLPEECRPESR